MKYLKLYAPVIIIVLLVLFTVIAATKAEADQYYNPYNQEYTTVQDRNDYNHRDDPQPEYGIEYNPYTGEYTVEREGAELEFNPHSGEYEYQR